MSSPLLDFFVWGPEAADLGAVLERSAQIAAGKNEGVSPHLFGLQLAASAASEAAFRARQDMLLLLCAAQFKRRLGAKATPEELSLDKKALKKLGFARFSAYKTWKSDSLDWESAKKLANNDEKLREKASILDVREESSRILEESFAAGTFTIRVLLAINQQKIAKNLSRKCFFELKNCKNVMEKCKIAPKNAQKTLFFKIKETEKAFK